MNTVRIAVCDDEKMSRDTNIRLCRKMCAKHDIDIEIKGYETGSDLMFDLEEPAFQNSLDLLLLDITMPGMNGIDVAKEARELGYKGVIIFITVSNEHFKDAFDVGAFHYINKEESVKRFEEILLKAIAYTKDAGRKEILLSSWGELKKLEIDSIEYFEVINRVITVYYGDKKFDFQGSLKKLEDRLLDCGFHRIHRNYLVSLSYVNSISFKSVIMSNGKTLPVGRKYYSGLKGAINIIKM